jgi:hypothetical protein
MGRYFELVPNRYRVYKIIPHHSALNQTNRKLLASLHQVFSMYNSPWSRTWREGLKIYHQEKDTMRWMVSIKGGEGEGDPAQVEFYVAVTETFVDVFLLKLNNHEQWKRCTIEETDPVVMAIPNGAELYRLKYARANMFSLSYDLNQQTTPIRELVNVATEVSPGESANLLIQAETVDRRRWRGLADYAWSTWEKGGVPQRDSVDLLRTWRQAWRVAGRALNEIKSIVDEVMAGVEKAFMSGKDQDVSRKELDLPDPERQELLVNGDLSAYTKRKRNLPVFRAELYVAVKADTPEKRGVLARSMTGAFNELAGDNYFVMSKITLRRGADGKFHRLPCDRDACMMSTEELGKIMQLPTGQVQDEYREHLNTNRRVEIAVPEAFADQTGIFAGTAALKGQVQPVYIPCKDADMLMTARAFIGSPRVGKDQAAINLVVEAKRKHGIGAVIPDVIDERGGHRGMADAIRDHLDPDDVIDLNLGDYDWPVYIGLEGVTGSIKNERVAANRIAQELTNFLMGDDIENHQTREYLREAAKLTRGDLLGIKLLFMSEAYRQKIITEARQQGFDVSIWVDFDKMSEGKQGQIYGPVMTRLGELMGDEVLKPIFCQRPNPAIDLDRWMREGKVVIYRIPSRDLGEMAVKTLTHWIILTTFLTKLAQGGEGTPTWLILNEPHQFLSKGLIHFCKRLLAEGPKYRIAPVFLFHHFKQLPADFVEILLSSSLNWHIFKNTNDGVYKRLEQYLAPTFTPETAMAGTGRFQYIAAWLDSMGEYQPPFLVNAPDMIGKRYDTRDNSFLTRRHSRVYGRAIWQVAGEIGTRGRMAEAGGLK